MPEAALKHPPNQPRSKPPFAPEANPKHTPPVSSPPLHSPSSLPPEIPKEITVVSEGPNRVTREANPETTTAPKSLEDALREPPAFRADLATRDPMLADLMQAHRWPDVQAVLGAWHEARGGTGAPKVTIPSRDGAVRAVLVLIGMGHLPSDLGRVARHLAKAEGFRDKASASVMTPEVVRIALDELDRKKPTNAGHDLVRRVEAARGPQAVGDALKGLAAGGRP